MWCMILSKIDALKDFLHSAEVAEIADAVLWCQRYI